MKKEIQYCSFVVFIYIVCVVVSAETTEDCTVKEHLPCTLYKSINDCSRPALEPRFPFMYANDSWPGKVSSFNASITEDIYAGNQKYYSKGTFTFTPPQDGSIKFVKGFIVLRYRSDTTEVMCYVYDLSNATWKSGMEDYKTVFTLTLFPMKPNTYYLFDVYTLPKIPGDFDKKESLGLHLNVPRSRDDALGWTANITPQVIPERREVKVSFVAPPESFNFIFFEIILKNITHGARQTVNTNKTEHTFTDVENGVYEVWVMPKQESCGCRDSKLVCRPCLTTRSANFTVDIDDALGWTANITPQVIPERREVKVSFVAPPESFNFIFFEIILKNITHGARQTVNTNKIEHTFTDVENGVYEVWVMPKQESCGCRDSKLVCRPCLTTRSANFIVDIVTSTMKATPSTSVVPVNSASTSGKQRHTEPEVGESSTRGQDDENTLKVVMAVIGAFLGVVLVGIMFALLYFCKWRRRGGKEVTDATTRDADLDSMATIEQLRAMTAVNNYNVEKKQLERRPKLFILYEEDHPYHRNVVDKFALYLQKHCSCDVMQAQLRLDTTWVHQESQNADYVIIVNSKLAFAIYQSLIRRNRGLPERTPSGNVHIPAINCILERFLQEPHYDKTVMVYFDYTNEGLVISDICPGYNYKLMKHFADLLMHIHKLKRTDNLAQYDLPLDGQYFLQPIGKDLRDAIKEAMSYERENPDWFAQKYGYLRSFSNASDESGFDSDLPQEPIFIDPVTKNLQSYLDATSQDAITVTPPIIAGEDERPYLRLAPQSFQREARQTYSLIRPVHETPTTGDSGVEFDFIPPDDVSGFEVASKSLSEQMLSINARNAGYDNKAYDWQQDLALLRVQSGEIPYGDSHSVGGESV